MRPFKYQRANGEAEAINGVSVNNSAKFLAGGSNLIDLMRANVVQPDELIDISSLALTQIRSSGDVISIGALARNKDTANHPLVKQSFPLLSQAILSGASAQIRNMATNGGNLNQRTRCSYFYDSAVPCNKRKPGSGCPAKEGLNRTHAIFGWSDSCVAVNPSDMNVALAALDAQILVKNKTGAIRKIAIRDYHKLPGSTPEIETAISHGELVTAIEIPKNRFADNSYYLKIRDRASFAFAIVSVAIGLEIKSGVIRDARVALGGVAAKPWIANAAAQSLIGKKPSPKVFEEAAQSELKNAKPLSQNEFKVELAKRAIVRAMSVASR